MTHCEIKLRENAPGVVNMCLMWTMNGIARRYLDNFKKNKTIDTPKIVNILFLTIDVNYFRSVYCFVLFIWIKPVNL